jgi:hypothetical protein
MTSFSIKEWVVRDCRLPSNGNAAHCNAMQCNAMAALQARSLPCPLLSPQQQQQQQQQEEVLVPAR